MIELYVREGCPFCHRVINKINELKLKENIDYKLIDAAPGTPGREVVLKKGGKSQVPFMIDGNLNMYESGDIISYIETKFSR